MRKRFALTTDVAAAINDIFNQAKTYRFTHDQLIERLQSIRDELNARTPGGARRYSENMAHFANGYIQARNDDVWRHEVEFCYRDASGVLFSTHRESAHRKTEEFYSAGRGAELGKLESAHVWKDTDKQFSPWKVL